MTQTTLQEAKAARGTTGKTIHAESMEVTISVGVVVIKQSLGYVVFWNPHKKGWKTFCALDDEDDITSISEATCAIREAVKTGTT